MLNREGQLGKQASILKHYQLLMYKQDGGAGSWEVLELNQPCTGRVCNGDRTVQACCSHGVCMESDVLLRRSM